MLTQENVITNMELRADFSLYCVHKETQLVYAYLGTLSPAISSLLNNNINSHSEVMFEKSYCLPELMRSLFFQLYSMWKQIQNSIQSHLSDESTSDAAVLRK